MTGNDNGSATAVVAVLAAGGSRRLGLPKQLVPFRGKPLLRTVMEAACATPCRVAVVLGAHADEITPCLAGLDTDVLLNRHWSDGMSTSIHRAVCWAMTQAASALLIASCDQPLLDTRQLRRLIELSHPPARRPPRATPACAASPRSSRAICSPTC